MAVWTSSRTRRRVAAAGLINILALIHVAGARAAEECGEAQPGDTIVCEATGKPYEAIDYSGVDDFGLVLGDGVVVEGSITVMGDGAISVVSEPGSVIDGAIQPAMDIGSTSGTVTIDVHEVSGDFHAVAAVAGGDVAVSADKVSGTIAIQAESVEGDVTVDAGQAFTHGEGGAGVFAATGDGTVTVSVDEIHANDVLYSQGVIALSDSGDIHVDVGTIEMAANRSEGVRADSYSGDIHVKVDSITLIGGENVGISAVNDTGRTVIEAGSIVTRGNVGRGILAASFGDILVTADYVETDGFIYDGLQLLSTEGDVMASVGDIVARGDWSIGITAETGGSVAFDIGSVTTFGEFGDGIGAFAGGDVTIDVDSVQVFGPGSSGIIVGTGGNQTINVGTVIARGTENAGGVAIGTTAFDGDVAIRVREAAISGRDSAIVTQSVNGGVSVAVDAGATVAGRLGGIFAASRTGTRLDIAGTVSAVEGPTLNILGGAADVRIGATGTVRGSLLLTDRGDLVTNDGRILLAGESNFAGGYDRLVNNGRIGISAAETPATVRLLGLDRLDNGGSISLANGRTGDLFWLSGNLHGRGDASLALDVSLADGGTADTVRVGSLSGVTTLSLDFAEAAGGLGLGEVVLARSEGDAPPGALVLDEASSSLGFVDFSLAFNAAGRSWRLRGDLNDRGFRTALVGQGARDLWREGVRAWSTGLTLAPAGEGLQAWAQGLAGGNDRDGTASSGGTDRSIDWRARHDGVQLGLEKAGNGWRFGLTGGYGSEEMDWRDGDESRFDGFNLGAYAAYEGAAWFARGLVRADWLDLETDWASVGLDEEGDAETIGAALELGHRAELAGFSLEPTVSLQWIDTDLPDFAGTSGTARFSGGSAFTADAGLWLGAGEGWAGLPVRPWLSLGAGVEAGRGDRVDLTIGEDQVRIEEEGTGAYARAGLGISGDVGRVRLYAQGEGRIGDVEGLNAVVGARLSF